MDISTFMSWWVVQVLNIITYVYTTLNSITFANTSLLKVIIFINIIIPFLLIMVSVANTGRNIADRKMKRERNNKNDK